MNDLDMAALQNAQGSAGANAYIGPPVYRHASKASGILDAFEWKCHSATGRFDLPRRQEWMTVTGLIYVG